MRTGATGAKTTAFASAISSPACASL
jgi:hypothetical protein